MKDLISRMIFGWRFKHSVKKADEMHKLTSLKYLVIVLNGKLQVVAKKDLKRLINTRYFKKGTKIEHLESRSLYTTR
jgi:hypothetical protein